MKKKILIGALSVALSIALVFTGTQLWNFFIEASNTIPGFDSEKHTKVLDVGPVLFTENIRLAI